VALMPSPLHHKVRAVAMVIADEKNWTSGAHARDAEGRPVTYMPNATQWSLVGAYHASEAERSAYTLELYAFLLSAARAQGFDSLKALNDALGHAGVMDFLRAAYRKAQQQEGGG
jgi:hypothetical protein